MYICIDESGVQNPQKNKYFVIAGFICENITKIRSIHKKIEKQLKQNNPKLSNKVELKAYDLDSTAKAKFINGILKVDDVFIFCICYDLRNKALMKRLKQNEDKYNYLKNGKLEIRLDNRNVKNSYNDKLEDYLIKHSHFSYKYNVDIKKCSYHDSKKTREVQMADYIANIFWTKRNYPRTESVLKQVPSWNQNSFLWEYSKNVIVMDKPNLKISRENLSLMYNNSFELILWINFERIGLYGNDIILAFRSYKDNHEIKDIVDSNSFCFENKYWKVLITPENNCLIITGVKNKIQNMLDDLKMDINIHQLINYQKIL